MNTNTIWQSCEREREREFLETETPESISRKIIEWSIKQPRSCIYRLAESITTSLFIRWCGEE